jgi:radical SAM superfamily enzyme YgiQ (UPF0313 family)
LTDPQTVCLVVPPSVFLLDERVFMTIGILKVAAVLEQAGHAVEMVDLSGVENFESAMAHHARHSSATMFGLTATTPQMPATMRIATAIRGERADARVVLGGTHATLVNAAYKREQKAGRLGRAARAFAHLESAFNVVVAGDGEDAVFLTLGPDAPPLVDADEPTSSLFMTPLRLAQLPLPARHLVDVASYHYEIDGVRAVSLIAQLGCPFSCGFCGGRDSPFLRRARSRPSGKVVDEIRHLHETYGFKGFMLYDDELNVTPKMVEMMNAIADLQDELGVEFRLRGFIKAELFTDEQAEAMYRAGFRWLLTGFESGSERILRNINKKATQQDNTRCIEIARRHNLKVKALMSIGHPGESAETIRQTHEWLLDVHPDDFDVTIITTYPGSPYYDHATQDPSDSNVWTYEYQGDRLHAYEVDYTQVADYYKGNPDGGYRSFVYTDFLTADELVAHRDFVERDVRARLHIPFNAGAPAIRFEHSMGQSGPLPPNIFRSTSQAPLLP